MRKIYNNSSHTVVFGGREALGLDSVVQLSCLLQQVGHLWPGLSVAATRPRFSHRHSPGEKRKEVIPSLTVRKKISSKAQPANLLSHTSIIHQNYDTRPGLTQLLAKRTDLSWLAQTHQDSQTGKTQTPLSTWPPRIQTKLGSVSRRKQQ